MPQFPAVINLWELDGSNGFQMYGSVPNDNAGVKVSWAGDVNGDGFDDFVIGTSSWWDYWHPVTHNGDYVVFGTAAGFEPTFALSDLDGSNGFKVLYGFPSGYGGGTTTSSAGDVNGDGFDDVIVGVPDALANGQQFGGMSYVIFGKPSGFGENFSVADVNGLNGFSVSGEAENDFAGASVASAGDVNGDGFDDLTIGAWGADPNGVLWAGSTYVVFGRASGFGTNLNLSALDGTNGFQINGEAYGDHSGFSVSAAGDVNGDSFADFIIGAPDADPNGSSSGASYVVFGKASGFGATVELSSLNGSNGFKISGGTTNNALGESVSSAGDVDGDGFDDVIIGSSAAAYVVFGKATPFAATFDVSSLDGINGFKISSPGTDVSSAGDVNGDSFADVVIGGSNGAYVVFGKSSGFAATVETSSLDGSNGFQVEGAESVSSAGDVNGDGFDDVLFGQWNAVSGGAAYVVFGHATGQTIQTKASPDFNNDLRADLLWQNTDGTVAAWLMNGTNLVSGSAIGANPGSNWHVKAGADFDGNGKADILWQSADGTPVIWFMDGTTMLSGGVAGFNPGAAWHVIGAGDFNGDGHADILWQNADGTPAIWLMNGTTLLSGGALSNPGTSWHAIGSGDFNGDGNSDILWQNGDGTAAVWLLNGTTLIGGGAVGSNPGTQWHVKAAGDFNADGNSDILWQHDDGTPVVWFMNGTSVLSGAVAASNPGSSWHAIGASDFNGDGKSDIAWQNSDGTPAIWLMNGTTLLSGTAYANPGAAWHLIASGS